MPCIPGISVICTEVHLELGSLKLHRIGSSMGSSVLEDLDGCSFVVRKNILIIICLRGVEFVLQIIARLQIIHSD